MVSPSISAQPQLASRWLRYNGGEDVALSCGSQHLLLTATTPVPQPSLLKGLFNRENCKIQQDVYEKGVSNCYFSLQFLFLNRDICKTASKQLILWISDSNNRDTVSDSSCWTARYWLLTVQVLLLTVQNSQLNCVDAWEGIECSEYIYNEEKKTNIDLRETEQVNEETLSS